MTSAATTEIEFAEPSELPTSSPMDSENYLLPTKHAFWLEWKKQKGLFFLFPILAIASAILLRLGQGLFPGGETFSLEYILQLWPVLHLTFAGILAFGPDFETENWRWDQMFPVSLRIKFATKAIMTFFSSLASLVAVMIIGLSIFPTTEETFRVLFTQDLTLTLPFSLLAIFLCLLNTAIFKNIAFTCLAGLILGDNSSEYLFSFLTGSYGHTFHYTLFIIRALLIPVMMFAVTVTFIWRMKSDRIIDLRLGSLFQHKGSTVSRNRFRTRVKLSTAFSKSWTISSFLIQQNFWVCSAFAFLLVFSIYSSIVNWNFLSHGDQFALSIFLFSVFPAVAWGSHVGDKQREFLRQFPINPYHYLLIVFLTFFVTPAVSIGFVFGHSTSQTFIIIAILFATFCIVSLAGLSFRSKLIAWFVGSLVSFANFLILSSSPVISNLTFGFYLYFAALPFLIFLIWKIRPYFEEDQFSLWKQFSASSAIWLGISVFLIITGRIYSIPHKTLPPVGMGKLKTSFSVPVIPQEPKWAREIENRLRSDRFNTIGYSNHGAVQRIPEDFQTKGFRTVTFFRQIPTHPNGYSLDKTRVPNKFYAQGENYHDSEAFAYATEKLNPIIQKELNELQESKFGPALQTLNSKIRSTEQIMTVKSNHKDANEEVSDYLRNLTAWEKVCNDAFELSLAIGDKKNALLALDLLSTLHNSTRDLRWSYYEMQSLNQTMFTRFVGNYSPLNHGFVTPFINRYDTIGGFEILKNKLPKSLNLREYLEVNQATSIKRIQSVSERNMSWDSLTEGDPLFLPWENARRRRMIILEADASYHYDGTQKYRETPVTVFNWIDVLAKSRNWLLEAQPIASNVNTYTAAVHENAISNRNAKRLSQLEHAWKIYRYDRGKDRPEWGMEKYLKNSTLPQRLLNSEEKNGSKGENRPSNN